MPPPQKPGRSKQDYGTPSDLLAAVESLLGRPIDFDLAASPENAKAPRYYTAADDALSQRWPDALWPDAPILWLNPPFGRIAPWAAKCWDWTTHTRHADARLLLLTPASVGATWFTRWVYGHAFVLALQPRLTFEGMTTPFPKDCMLSIYGEPPGFEVWKWR